jgi:hypothetical protein
MGSPEGIVLYSQHRQKHSQGRGYATTFSGIYSIVEPLDRRGNYTKIQFKEDDKLITPDGFFQRIPRQPIEILGIGQSDREKMYPYQLFTVVQSPQITDVCRAFAIMIEDKKTTLENKRLGLNKYEDEKQGLSMARLKTLAKKMKLPNWDTRSYGASSRRDILRDAFDIDHLTQDEESVKAYIGQPYKPLKGFVYKRAPAPARAPAPVEDEKKDFFLVEPQAEQRRRLLTFSDDMEGVD